MNGIALVVKTDSQSIKLYLEDHLLSGQLSSDTETLGSGKRCVALGHSLTS